MTAQVGIITAKSELMACWGDACQLVEKFGTKWLEIVDLKEIFSMVATGEVDLWLGTDGEQLEFVGFCAWERHAKVSYYFVLWAGGERLSKYLPLALDKTEQYCCMLGGEKVKIGGRAGWMKLLPKFGYSPGSVIMEKAVAMQPKSVN